MAYFKVNHRCASSKFLTIIFFLLSLSYVNAEVYKWLDESGKVVYGDKPTSNNADKVKLKKTPVLDPVVQEQNKKQNKLLDVIAQEREERTLLKKEEKAKKEEQKKVCADARRNLKKNKEASSLYTKTDDPDNPRIWTNEERNAEEKRFEEFIKKNC